MDPLATFLREHAAVHSRRVHEVPHNMDWIVEGLPDDALRAQPHGLNSLAWLLWHVARIEDGCVGAALCGAAPLFDADWAARLGVRVEPDYMSKADVAAFSTAVDLASLQAYRDAVGTRTRTLVAARWPDAWETPFDEAGLARGVAAGVLESGQTYLVGTPGDELLLWWGLHHTWHHLGQMALVRAQLDR